VLAKLRQFVDDRIPNHLRRRYTLYSRAHAYKRFPTKRIYELFGVYKVPTTATTAGWKKAHALVWRISVSRVRENCRHGLMREGWSYQLSTLPLSLLASSWFLDTLSISYEKRTTSAHPTIDLTGSLVT